jgi:hypothetical protein
MADEQDYQQPGRTRCKLDIHREIWDLGGTMTAEFYNASDPTEPTGVIHEDETLRVRVTIELTGRILGYLCNTKIGVSLAFESCGSGFEGEWCQWQELYPCEQDTYYFDFEIPGRRLRAGECGKQYELCITLSSKDCCGRVGFIFGTCREATITVLPTDVSDTPTPAAEADEAATGEQPAAGAGDKA